MKRIILILMLSIISFHARGQDVHYRIKEGRAPSSWQGPGELLYAQFHEQVEELKQVFNMWEFALVQGRPDQGAVPYNRSRHFGSWRRGSASCLNTRADVLIRDSQIPVKMRSSGCTVDSGLWTDPYGGRDYRRASDIEIDHFVPLKNAYINGAHKWTAAKRCVYTNFLGDAEHLLPVHSKENGKKSDRAPDGYMPPQRSYHCRYIANWLRIKFTWGLALSSSEKERIENIIRGENCSLQEFQISPSELQRLRRFIADNEKTCQ